MNVGILGSGDVAKALGAGSGEAWTQRMDPRYARLTAEGRTRFTRSQA